MLRNRLTLHKSFRWKSITENPKKSQKKFQTLRLPRTTEEITDRFSNQIPQTTVKIHGIFDEKPQNRATKTSISCDIFGEPDLGLFEN